jgi:hypothetical protein
MSWFKDFVGGIDHIANSINPMEQPMKWLTENTIGKVPGVGKPAAQLYDYSNSHPLESLAAMGAIYYGGAALGNMGEGGAGAGEAGSAAADSGSINLFADAVPGAGGDVGASVGGAGNAGASSGIDWQKMLQNQLQSSYGSGGSSSGGSSSGGGGGSSNAPQDSFFNTFAGPGSNLPGYMYQGGGLPAMLSLGLNNL